MVNKVTTIGLNMSIGALLGIILVLSLSLFVPWALVRGILIFSAGLIVLFGLRIGVKTIGK